MQTAYIFAGGGTGGHIFPALAIAEQLETLTGGAGDNTRSIFIVSDRPLDSEILDAEGAEYNIIPARPFGVRPRALVRFAKSWGPSVRECREIIRGLRKGGEQVHMVAMGGFVAAPAAQAAKVERVPLTLVNMDAIPGKANRWVARRAARVVTSAPVDGSNWDLVPPIVRSVALANKPPAECRVELGLDPSLNTLLVTGASQGARSINRFMMRLAKDSPGAFRGWQVIHQTGSGEDEAVADAYEAAGIPGIIAPFFDRMGVCWGSADLAVSRAGAGSVAEAWANHVPTIFLPYPYHKDQHQRYNARPLEQAGAALIITDRINDAANADDAGKHLLDLMAAPAKRDPMHKALQKLGSADGAKRIAEMLLKAQST